MNIARTQKDLRARARGHKHQEALSSRYRLLADQLGCLSEAEQSTAHGSEVTASRLRGLIAETSHELEQIIHDGGEYVVANHVRRA